MHIKCRDNVLASSMSDQCVMCRAKHPSSDKEVIEQLHPWVEKGKAWAQSSLGDEYHQRYRC